MHCLVYMHLLLLVLLALPLLNGCYTPLVEGAQEGYDGVRRDTLHQQALTGKPVAQYEYGDSWCCHGGGPMDKVSIYDNHKATEWYCRAAHQGYAPAQLRLAQIVRALGQVQHAVYEHRHGVVVSEPAVGVGKRSAEREQQLTRR